MTDTRVGSEKLRETLDLARASRGFGTLDPLVHVCEESVVMDTFDDRVEHPRTSG